MKILLTVLTASAIFLAAASAGIACGFKSAGKHDAMTVTEAPASADEKREGMSTFDPEKLSEELKVSGPEAAQKTE